MTETVKQKTKRNQRKDVLQFDTCYVQDDTLWISALLFNGLFKYNLKSRKLEHVGQFPNEKFIGRLHFHRIIEVDEKLYFTPCESQHIHIFDTKTKQFDSILIENKVGFHHEAARYKEKVIFISKQIEKLLVLDTITRKIEHVKTIDGISGYTPRAYIIDSFLYLTSADDRYFIRVDLDTYKSEVIACQDGIRIAGKKEKLIYLQDIQKKKLLAFDTASNVCVEEINCDLGTEQPAFQIENYIINTSTGKENIIAFNTDTNELTIKEKPISKPVLYWRGGLYPFSYDGRVFFIFGDDFTAVDIESGESEYSFELSEEMTEDIKRQYKAELEKGDNTDVFRENNFLQLGDLVEKVKRQ